MSKEREYMENLLCQRFNFFLVFFGFIITGALEAKTKLHIDLILTIGFVVEFLFMLVLRRTHDKLNLIIGKLADDHPMKIIDREAGPSSRRGLIGEAIPVFCTVTLLVGTAFAWSDCFPLNHLHDQEMYEKPKRRDNSTEEIVPQGSAPTLNENSRNQSGC